MAAEDKKLGTDILSELAPLAPSKAKTAPKKVVAPKPVIEAPKPVRMQGTPDDPMMRLDAFLSVEGIKKHRQAGFLRWLQNRKVSATLLSEWRKLYKQYMSRPVPGRARGN